jgi:type VI protein secretion system component VasF
LIEKQFVSAALEETFTLRRTKVADKFVIATKQALLLRGQQVTAMNREAQDLSYVIATLSTVCIAPLKYDFGEIVDETALYALWNEWDEWNSSFRSTQPSGDQPPS